jgi:hypothetical protein
VRGDLSNKPRRFAPAGLLNELGKSDQLEGLPCSMQRYDGQYDHRFARYYQQQTLLRHERTILVCRARSVKRTRGTFLPVRVPVAARPVA